MEYLVQGHTAPQGQSQKSIFLALNRVFFALLDTMVINHRLLGQKYIPVQKAWGAVENSLFLIICQYSSSFSPMQSPIGTDSNPLSRGFPWLQGRLCLCATLQIKGAKEGKLESDILKLKNMLVKFKFCKIADLIIIGDLPIYAHQAITAFWELRLGEWPTHLFQTWLYFSQFPKGTSSQDKQRHSDISPSS